MRLFGHPWSIYTRKVLAVLAEKGHEAELVVVDLPRGGQHAPEHAARHPFAKVPVLEDDGHSIYESLAIMRHLDRTLPGPALTPAAPFGASMMDQWLSVGSSYFAEPAHALVVEAVFKRVRKLGEPEPKAIEELRSKIEAPLAVADRWLSSRPYLAGDAFSLADITWMPYLEYLNRLAVGRAAIASHPHLARWWSRISERPAWLEVARRGDQPPIGADVAARA